MNNFQGLNDWNFQKDGDQFYITYEPLNFDATEAFKTFFQIGNDDKGGISVLMLDEVPKLISTHSHEFRNFLMKFIYSE